MDPDEPRLRKQKHEDAVTDTVGSTDVVGERPLLNQSSGALTTLMDELNSSKHKQTDTETKVATEDADDPTDVVNATPRAQRDQGSEAPTFLPKQEDNVTKGLIPHYKSLRNWT